MLSKALVVGAYQRKLEELARLPGVELTAIVPPGWRDRRGTVSLERAHTAGYELLVAPLAFNGSYHLHFYPTLGRLLHQLRPEILHVDEEPYNLATWHALRLAQGIGARALFFTWQNLDRRYPWPFRLFEAANYRRAAYAIAGNQAAAQVLRAKGYTGPVAVIPQFGVDPDIFSPAPAASPSLPHRGASLRAQQGDLPAVDLDIESYTIGYAGGLIPEKGIDLLLHACAGLSFRDWTLLILGEGPDRQRLQALADGLQISDRVQFLGHWPSTETPAFYRTLDLLVLPSVSRPNWIEQFGRVLVEAMACGVPVVGSDCGELPYVIGDAGLIFPEGDVSALRAAIEELAADPARRAALAAAGRARVLNRFTQAQVAAETYRVYQEMMRNAEFIPQPNIYAFSANVAE